MAAIGLEALLGIGALGGGLALMAGPNGEIIPLPVRALAGSPFGDYFAPGAILFAVLGLGPLGAALLAWRRHRAAPFLAFAVGGALLVWLVVEIAIVGYSSSPPLQALYLGLGVVIALVGVGWVRQTHGLSPQGESPVQPSPRSLSRQQLRRGRESAVRVRRNVVSHFAK